MPALIDSHCHFDFFPAAERARLRSRARQAGVAGVLIPAVAAAQWTQIATLCRQESSADFFLCAAYGLHPLYLQEHDERDLLLLDEFLRREAAVGIGECGLDFYAAQTPPAQQQKFFVAQLELAQSHRLPLVIHARKSLEQVLQTLRRYPDVAFVIHSFTGSDRQLQQILDLGGYIGVGGTATYPRAQRLRRQLAQLDEKRFLLETDAPDQPLYGHQGQANEPARAAEVAAVLAALRGSDTAAVIAQSADNFYRLFHRTRSCLMPMPAPTLSSAVPPANICNNAPS